MNLSAKHGNGPVLENPDSGRRSSVKRLLSMALSILVSLSLLASAGFFYIASQRDDVMRTDLEDWHVMRAELEDRVEWVIGLLDADRQQTWAKRRYFDYGLWASLGLAGFYWSTLVVRWMGRRRQRTAAVRRQEAVLMEGSPSPWGMDAVPAAAGGPGFPLEDAGRAGEGERPAQSRQAGWAQGSALRARPGEAPVIGGRAAPTLEERLKARDEAYRTQREDPGRAGIREQGTAVTERRDAPVPAAEADVPASGPAEPEPSLEERLEALKADLKARQQRAPETIRGGQYGDPLPDGAEGAGEQGAAATEGRAVPADRIAGASGNGRASPGRTLEERLNALKAERDDRRVRHGEPLPGNAEEPGAATAEGRDSPVDASASVRTSSALEERLRALKAGAGTRRAPEPSPPPVPGDTRGQGAVVTGREQEQTEGDPGFRLPSMTATEDAPSMDRARSAERIRTDTRIPQAQARTGAAEVEPGTAGARVRSGEPGDGMPATRGPAILEGGALPSMRRPAESGADATAGEYLAREREKYGRPPAAPDLASAPDGGPERNGGQGLPVRDREAEATPPPAQPDDSELVHQAIRDAILDRLQEIEQEIRAAANAAEQAEHTRRNPDGEGHQDDIAWMAATGRMAGARWAVHTLLKEVDRLPAAPAPRGAPGLIDMGVLLERQLGALAGEDRKRIDATLVPGAVTRGSPRALETAADIIVQHALEGARLHPGGEGYVTLTLVQENDGVHLTCLDHGPGGNGSGDRRSLALTVARSLIEGQDGEMEITPYLRHGTMVRLRLPSARSSM